MGDDETRRQREAIEKLRREAARLRPTDLRDGEFFLPDGRVVMSLSHAAELMQTRNHSANVGSAGALRGVHVHTARRYVGAPNLPGTPVHRTAVPGVIVDPID